MSFGFGKYRYINPFKIDYDYVLSIVPYEFKTYGYDRYVLYKKQIGKSKEHIDKSKEYVIVFCSNSYAEFRMKLDLNGITQIVYIERSVAKNNKNSNFYIYFKKND